MIDRGARREAAEAIRHFVAGRITNEEFVNRYPYSKKDPVIRALDDTFWLFYDDIREHTLAGEFALPDGLRKEIVRWLMFLYTDEEYRWPRLRYAGVRDLYRPTWIGRLTGYANYVERKTADFKEHGDYDAWPFLSREDFKKARKEPALLGGRA